MTYDHTFLGIIYCYSIISISFPRIDSNIDSFTDICYGLKSPTYRESITLPYHFVYFVADVKFVKHQLGLLQFIAKVTKFLPALTVGKNYGLDTAS